MVRTSNGMDSWSRLMSIPWQEPVNTNSGWDRPAHSNITWEELESVKTNGKNFKGFTLLCFCSVFVFLSVLALRRSDTHDATLCSVQLRRLLCSWIPLSYSTAHNWMFHYFCVLNPIIIFTHPKFAKLGSKSGVLRTSMTSASYNSATLARYMRVYIRDNAQ